MRTLSSLLSVSFYQENQGEGKWETHLQGRNLHIVTKANRARENSPCHHCALTLDRETVVDCHKEVSWGVSWWQVSLRLQDLKKKDKSSTMPGWKVMTATQQKAGKQMIDWTNLQFYWFQASPNELRTHQCQINCVCHRGGAHLAAGTVRFSALERFGAAHLAWLAKPHWR